MAELRVSYDQSTRSAILEADNDDVAWAKIRRACEDHSDQVQILSGTRLSIPWWQFLSCRNAVNYHVVRHDLDLKADVEARTFLERAQQRTSAFESRSEAPTSLDLDAKLRELGFTRQLTPEQKRNVSKLYGLPAGATFSVPGAGKTTEALAVFFLKRTQDTRLLVIAPKNAFAAWETQLALCAPQTDLKFVRLVGGESRIKVLLEAKPKMMLITYQQLQFARDLIASDVVENTFIYLDESHRIKRGLDGRIGGTVLSLSHLPEHKLILSGTPIPNTNDDLLPQFSFLFPEVAASDDIAKLIRPFYVRTTKSELGLKLPDRHLIPISMSEGQHRLYQLMRHETARQADTALKSRDRNRFRALGRSVIRLLQLTSNPSLLARTGGLPEDVVTDILAEGDSAKLQWTCNRARELARRGHKVVIWSTFVENVELIARRLSDVGADYIHGGVDAGSDEEEETREWKIKKFHMPKRNFVLVANPAACGEGISLHEVCHHAIYVDRNYNAAQYLQSEDRIHRLGLDRNQSTTVEILCCIGSIDESVNRRLIEKIRRMAEVLNDRDLHIDPVSFEPKSIDDDEALDEADARDLLDHLTAPGEGAR